MIKFGNLKDDLMSSLNMIDGLKGVSVGARLLCAKILRCHEDWKISWNYFADVLGVSRFTLYRWRDELTRAGVWDIKQSENDKFSVVFLIQNEAEQKCDNVADLRQCSEVQKCDNVAKSHTIKEREIRRISKQKREFKKTNKKSKISQENFSDFLNTLDFSAFNEQEKQKLLEYIDFKKELEKKTPTQRSIKSLLNRANDFKNKGVNLCECVENSICSNWRNIYEPRVSVAWQNRGEAAAKKPFIPRFFNANDECKFIMGEMEKLCLCDKGDISKFWLMNYDELAAKYPQVLGCKVGLVGGYLAFLRDSKVG